jgi:hypothetical protein
MSLKLNRPDLYERLLDIIHMMTDKTSRRMLADQALYIDWEEVARTMNGVGWGSLPSVIKPVETKPVSRFDGLLPVMRSIDEVAPVLKDAPKPLAEVRDELNQLIKENAEGHIMVNATARILGILEQILMKLENVPTFKTIPGMAPFPVMPTYPAIVTPPPFAPAWPNTFPFSEPKSTTICGGTDTRAQQAMCQADGHTEVDEFGSIKS